MASAGVAKPRCPLEGGPVVVAGTPAGQEVPTTEARSPQSSDSTPRPDRPSLSVNGHDSLRTVCAVTVLGRLGFAVVVLGGHELSVGPA